MSPASQARRRRGDEGTRTTVARTDPREGGRRVAGLRALDSTKDTRLLRRVNAAESRRAAREGAPTALCHTRTTHLSLLWSDGVWAPSPHAVFYHLRAEHHCFLPCAPTAEGSRPPTPTPVLAPCSIDFPPFSVIR